jgi:hypothetical protein
MSKLGFLTMAFGHRRFLTQAENMGLSLKRHMPGIPVAIVTDRNVVHAAFDLAIPMKPFSKAGVVHKLDLYNYSPFDETLFIDSDCIITRPFHNELAAIREYDFSPVVGRYLHRGETDPFIADLAAALDQINGAAFPKFNGGVYFFKKSDLAQQVFSHANALRDKTTALGIRDFDKGGPNDETLIGLALAELRVSQLYDDLGNLMRTPVNIIGKLKVDALGGGCSFNKGGVFVSPAICHFPVEWLLSPEYKIAEYSLRKGHPPLPILKLNIVVQHHLNRFQRKLKSKLSHSLSGLCKWSHVQQVIPPIDVTQ